MSVVSENQATLREIEHAGKIFRLNGPIVVSFFEEDALVYCEYAPLSILSFGRSRDDAARSFCEDFAMLWDVVAQSPDESLTADARAVKQQLLAAVNSIVPE